MSRGGDLLEGPLRERIVSRLVHAGVGLGHEADLAGQIAVRVRGGGAASVRDALELLAGRVGVPHRGDEVRGFGLRVGIINGAPAARPTRSPRTEPGRAEGAFLSEVLP